MLWTIARWPPVRFSPGASRSSRNPRVGVAQRCHAAKHPAVSPVEATEDRCRPERAGPWRSCSRPSCCRWASSTSRRTPPWSWSRSSPRWRPRPSCVPPCTGSSRDRGAERLEREDMLSSSVIASVDRALVPTRGGVNSEFAAEAFDLVLRPEASVTVLTAHRPDHPADDRLCEQTLDSAAKHLGEHRVGHRRAVSATGTRLARAAEEIASPRSGLPGAWRGTPVAGVGAPGTARQVRGHEDRASGTLPAFEDRPSHRWTADPRAARSVHRHRRMPAPGGA